MSSDWAAGDQNEAAAVAQALQDATAELHDKLLRSLLALEGPAFLAMAKKNAFALHKMPTVSKAQFCRALHLRAVKSSGAHTSPNSALDLSIIEELLLHTFGAELTSLKLALDTMDASVHHDLLCLVRAISFLPGGEERRERLIAHFRQQAVAALAVWNELRHGECRERMRLLAGRTQRATQVAGSECSSSAGTHTPGAFTFLDTDSASGQATLRPELVTPADIASKAASAAQQAAAGEADGSELVLAPFWPVKLYADMDDTMAPRLFDSSFPGPAPYPGVSAFLNAMQGRHGQVLAAELRPHQEGAAESARPMPAAAPASTHALSLSDVAAAAAASAPLKPGSAAGAPLPSPSLVPIAAAGRVSRAGTRTQSMPGASRASVGVGPADASPLPLTLAPEPAGVSDGRRRLGAASAALSPTARLVVGGLRSVAAASARRLSGLSRSLGILAAEQPSASAGPTELAAADAQHMARSSALEPVSLVNAPALGAAVPPPRPMPPVTAVASESNSDPVAATLEELLLPVTLTAPPSDSAALAAAPVAPERIASRREATPEELLAERQPTLDAETRPRRHSWHHADDQRALVGDVTHINGSAGPRAGRVVRAPRLAAAAVPAGESVLAAAPAVALSGSDPAALDSVPRVASGPESSVSPSVRLRSVSDTDSSASQRTGLRNNRPNGSCAAGRVQRGAGDLRRSAGAAAASASSTTDGELPAPPIGWHVTGGSGGGPALARSFSTPAAAEPVPHPTTTSASEAGSRTGIPSHEGLRHSESDTWRRGVRDMPLASFDSPSASAAIGLLPSTRHDDASTRMPTAADSAALGTSPRLLVPVRLHPADGTAGRISRQASLQVHAPTSSVGSVRSTASTASSRSSAASAAGGSAGAAVLHVDSPIGHRGISGTVYLSARPALMKATTLSTTSGILGRAPHAILCGTIMTSLTHAGMAGKKADNFAAYHALFPEFRVVWVGDSGQGDIAAGLHMLQMHHDWARAAAAAQVAAAHASDASAAAKAALLAAQPPTPINAGSGMACCIAAPDPSAAPAGYGQRGSLRTVSASSSVSASGSASSPAEPDRCASRDIQHSSSDSSVSLASALALESAASALPEPQRWWPPPPPLILIHDICGSDQRPRTSQLQRATWRARGVHLFDSYVEAAAIAFEAGVLSEGALQHVIDGATRDLATVRFSSERQRTARLQEFTEAVRRAQMAMAAHHDRHCLARAALGRSAAGARELTSGSPLASPAAAPSTSPSSAASAAHSEAEPAGTRERSGGLVPTASAARVGVGPVASSLQPTAHLARLCDSPVCALRSAATTTASATAGHRPQTSSPCT